MDDASRRIASTRTAGLAALAAGITGIAASSCCVLPLLLATAGFGSVAAALVPTLVAWQGLILAVAVALVVAAWWAYLRRGRPDRGQKTGPWRVPTYLAVVSAVVLLALLWGPLIEYRLLAAVR